jgi:molybdopterin-guanine dinucleotide biosynthesis protein A
VILGILLAGGKSARMGSDKALLVLHGETLGAHAVRVLRGVCDEVVCAGHGRGVPDDVARILDAGAGPLVALAGVASMRAGPVAAAPMPLTFVALPVDMPGVDATHLARLLAARGSAAAACFLVDGTLEPLPTVFSHEAAFILADCVARGERRLVDGVRALAPALAPLPQHEGKLLQNMNTPADLHAWSMRGAGR